MKLITTDGVIADLVADVKLPRMVRVKQHFPRPVIENIPAEVRKQMDRPEILSQIKPGMRICLTGTSRGVSNFALVLRELVSIIKERGAEAFIVPAMGSHGGATAEGQREILTGYNVTEEFCGCPVECTMEVRYIGDTPQGNPVYIDRYAAEADGIIIVGRIKPHTGFSGPYESGMMKMMAIGLAKQQGAEECHRAGFKYMKDMVPMFGNAIVEHANVLFGFALIENPYDETAKMVTLTCDEIRKDEPALLQESYALMPRILFDPLDVLIIEQSGKNFSGDGMDPNITGRFCTGYAEGGIDAQKVVLLDLSDETHGNAMGLGLADFTTERVWNKTDLNMTYPNAYTSKLPVAVMIPPVLPNDKMAIQSALKNCIEMDMDHPRMVIIPNTLHLDTIYISEALLPEAEGMENVEIVSSPMAFAFDETGAMIDFA